MGSQKDQFIGKTRPHYWVKNSINLKHSADILLCQMRTHGDERVNLTFEDSCGKLSEEISTVQMISGSYMFLAGLALENLLKAMYLYLDSSQVDAEKGRLSQKILDSRHNLRSLATEVNRSRGEILIELVEIGGFLDKLQKFIRWTGRYPVPKNFSELQSVDFDLEQDSTQVDSIYENLTKIMLRIGGVVSISPHLKWPLEIDLKSES